MGKIPIKSTETDVPAVRAKLTALPSAPPITVIALACELSRVFTHTARKGRKTAAIIFS